MDKELLRTLLEAFTEGVAAPPPPKPAEDCLLIRGWFVPQLAPAQPDPAVQP
jgi:hypothetical protein